MIKIIHPITGQVFEISEEKVIKFLEEVKELEQEVLDEQVSLEQEALDEQVSLEQEALDNQDTISDIDIVESTKKSTVQN